MSGTITRTVDGSAVVHVMEYIEGGDLLKFAQRQQGGCIDEFTLRPIVWDLATAIVDAKRLGSAVILVGLLTQKFICFV